MAKAKSLPKTTSLPPPRTKEMKDRVAAGVSKLRDNLVLYDPEPAMWLSTGVTVADAMFYRQALGIPSGVPIHLYGPKCSGKTLLCMMLARQCQQMGGLVVWIDTEYFPYNLAHLVGVNFRGPQFIHLRPTTLENSLDISERVYTECALADFPVLVVYDSIAGSDTLGNQKSQVEGGTYQQGNPSQYWSRFFKRVCIKQLIKTNVFLVFTNQVRLQLDFFSRGPTQTAPTGGYGVGHSMHIEVGCSAGNLCYPGSTSTKSKAKDKTVVGRWVQMKATKNRMGPAFLPVGFPIYHAWGVDNVLANLDFLKEVGVAKQNGSYYRMLDMNKQYRDWHSEALSDPDLAEDISTLAKETFVSLYYTWSEDMR